MSKVEHSIKQEELQPERRTTMRGSTDLQVSVRQRGKHKVQARLSNLSCSGALVRDCAISAGDQPLWLRLPGLESWEAVVRWKEPGVLGVEFERPLHPL